MRPALNWHIPSLSALRTFEAAARHLSFTRAAEEVHLTQSAVSRQIRALEDNLGVALFDRTQQRLTLTQAGSNYLVDIRNSLEGLQAATLKILTGTRGGILSVATLTAFGTKWLIPRLGRFHAQHPDILINLVTKSSEADLTTDQFDVAIYYGGGSWSGVNSLRLSREEMVPVCAPSFLGGKLTIKKPDGLAKYTLLQQSKRPNTWRDWFTSAGVNDVNVWAGPRFEHFYMVIQAALAGLGIAIVPRILIIEELRTGRLIEPSAHPALTREAYYLVHPEKKANEPKVIAFKEWLLCELADCDQYNI